MKSLALVVPKERGEEVRRSLIDSDMLRKDLRIEVGDDALYFPVKEEVHQAYPLEMREFHEEATRPRSYRDLVVVPDELRPLLPRSFDVVGDVVIVKIPEDLASFEDSIGSAFMKAQRGIRSVAVDKGIAGHRRRRLLRVIAGRETTQTVHREYGLDLALDPAKVYFSPRMATERRRVARQVRPGEVIVDAFCGAGPFALHMARRGARAVYAVDSNPRAITFLEENVRRNRLENVVALRGDVSEVLSILEPADRIVLDYPQDPMSYLPAAAAALKEVGTIHYYEVLEMVSLEDRLRGLQDPLPPGMTLEVLNVRKVRGYSPTQAHYAFDLRISKG